MRRGPFQPLQAVCMEGTMKDILLINPSYAQESRWITKEQDLRVQKQDMVPLGLATVAALTPDDYRVDIWDELIRGPIRRDTSLGRHYDLVGITSHRVTLPRCKQLAALFHERNLPVAIGGPGVTGSPDQCYEHFDILFIGEAEKTWPQFLRDWEAGNHRSEYRQVEKIDLSISPIPKWDGIIPYLSRYAMGCVQTTRGCPFDCEFCDVVYLFGRRPRHKPIEKVLEEVRTLERLGMSSVFFSDDEFVGDRRYAKELLQALIPLNNSFEEPLTFSTQVSMKVCQSEELLELLADANFYLLFLGIETPNAESIKEAGKYQNLREDPLADIHKVLSYGIAIRGGTIVGFDHDDTGIFDIQYDFIQKACLPSVSLNMLKAAIGTKLWRRLRQEGRILDVSGIVAEGFARILTNIIPKRMSRIELMQGFRDLMDRVYSWTSFKERMLGFISLVKRCPRVRQKPVSKDELIGLGASLGVEPEGSKAIEEIFEYTEQRAPFMMRRVKELVVQHARYRQSLAHLMPQLDRQIELESSGKLKLKQDDRPIPIPQAFRASYSNIFPEVYRYVDLNLNDKDKLSDALVEVFVDFLVRCGEGLDQIEEYHRAYIKEICDQVCAKFNGQAPEEFIPVGDNGTTMPIPHGILRFGDDVLKSVEQEMIRLFTCRPGL